MLKKQAPYYLIAVLLIVLILGGSCLSSSSVNSNSQTPSRIIHTIPPGTLTAISQMKSSSQTPEPNPMGIPWDDLDGLELDFWYIWDLDEPGAGMHAIVDRFNQENPWGITVKALDQGLVLDPIGSVETAFENGLVPNLMIIDSQVIPAWYERGLTIDLSQLITDPVAGMTPEEQASFYPGIMEDLTSNGSDLPAIPFSQSLQVVYYNDSWADELGFNDVPRDFKEFRKQSCARGEDNSPAGAVFSPQIENILAFLSAYGGSFYLPQEETYQFTVPEVQDLARDLQALFEDGCGKLIANYPNPMALEMEFDLFNNRGALMMMGPTRLMDHIHTGPNQTGRPDDWSMQPFWGPSGAKAVAADLQSAVIFKATAEEELASWLFLKYLVSPQVQAEWASYSYFYPTRKDSLWYLRDFRQENPHWAEGLNLLKYARSSPFQPAWGVIQLAVEDAFEEIYTDPDLDPNAQLVRLSQVAQELWDELEE